MSESNFYKQGYMDYLFNKHMNPYSKLHQTFQYNLWKAGYNAALKKYEEVEKPFDFKQAII